MSYIRDPDKKQLDVLYKMASFEGKRVLEVGCGEGHLTRGYAEKTLHTIAIDPGEEKIQVAREKTPDHLRSRISLVVSSIDDFSPAEDQPEFDMVLFGWSL